MLVQAMVPKLGGMTHFEVLGVAQDATPDEVSVAYLRAARQFHPDRLAGQGLADLAGSAGQVLARINEAAMVLGDVGRRAQYVGSLVAGPSPQQSSLPSVLEAESAFLKGEVFLKKGEHAKAVECFTLATKGNPSEPQYRAYLAWARFDDPRAHKEAIARETLHVMEVVVRERPRFARGHYWAGLLCKLLGDSRRAEQSFREAVAVDSGFIDASRELRLSELRRRSRPGEGKHEPPRASPLAKLFKK
ncbi:MAG: J domain-containing protein [Polyangia bacterium]|jgi:tetratricopeptide (TPR) repeat protein